MKFEREYIRCADRGNFSLGIPISPLTITHPFIDFCFPPSDNPPLKNKKVILIFPGVTGSSSEPYVQEMCGQALLSGGYSAAVVLNCLYTKDSDIDQRVIDPNDSEYVMQSIDLIHEKLGQDIELYGVGFSLGANHLLRFLGVNHDQNHRIKTAISISNPFEVLATCIVIKSAFFGIYDKCLKAMLQKPFLE